MHFLAHFASSLVVINPGVLRSYVGHTNSYVKNCQDFIHPTF